MLHYQTTENRYLSMQASPILKEYQTNTQYRSNIFMYSAYYTIRKRYAFSIAYKFKTQTVSQFE